MYAVYPDAQYSQVYFYVYGSVFYIFFTYKGKMGKGAPYTRLSILTNKNLMFDNLAAWLEVPLYQQWLASDLSKCLFDSNTGPL